MEPLLMSLGNLFFIQKKIILIEKNYLSKFLKLNAMTYSPKVEAVHKLSILRI
jgi:hypothetical protein